MGANDIKVGSELLDYALKINNIKENIDNARSQHAAIMNDLLESYDGQAIESINYYGGSMENHLNSLSELYDKTSIYLNYVFEQMKFTDEQLASIISSNGGGAQND